MFTVPFRDNHACTEDEEQAAAIRLYAQSITSHAHLKKVIRDVHPQLRRAVFDVLAPNLNFTAHWLIVKP